MRTRIALVMAAVVLAVAPVGAVEKGNPNVKSISAMAFGPNGVLFIGDTASAKVFAIETADTAPAGKGDVMVEKLGDKLGSALGTTSDNVTVNDFKVNPSSGNIYIGATRKGAGGGPVVMKLDREGKLSEFAKVPRIKTLLPRRSTTAGAAQALTADLAGLIATGCSAGATCGCGTGSATSSVNPKVSVISSAMAAFS